VGAILLGLALMALRSGVVALRLLTMFPIVLAVSSAMADGLKNIHFEREGAR